VIKVIGSTLPSLLLEKQVLDLQTECRKSEDFAAKYKHCWEKVKKEKEALEAA